MLLLLMIDDFPLVALPTLILLDLTPYLLNTRCLLARQIMPLTFLDTYQQMLDLLSMRVHAWYLRQYLLGSHPICE